MSRPLQIIGVAGHARHGKDTVCAAIAAELPGWTVMRLAFADPIKDIARELWGFTHAQVHGELKDTLDARWGFTPRFAFERVGAAARAIHEDTWVEHLRRRLQLAAKAAEMAGGRARERYLVVVPDVRRHNEARGLHGEGAYLWRVHRPGVDLTRESERDVSELRVDEQLTNDGTPEELRPKVRACLERSVLRVRL